MRAVVQRVSAASVSIEGRTTAEIENGLLVLLGIACDDGEKDLTYIEDKLLHLRIFDDENGVPNLDVSEVSGSILLISQFTLYGNAKKGRRPSYIRAARPEVAIPLYEKLKSRLKEKIPLKCGVFGADMKVSLINDGPFTILLDSRKEF
ncbi:MAG: D-aminoacyl-tRNA deacylase [Clostridia bacterium]|nr:D-aminoacyl-tRNA deacylase [Clostridia bacterium]